MFGTCVNIREFLHSRSLGAFSAPAALAPSFKCSSSKGLLSSCLTVWLLYTYLDVHICIHTPDCTKMITMPVYLLYQYSSPFQSWGPDPTHCRCSSLCMSRLTPLHSAASPALYPASVTSGTTVARLSSKRNSCFDSVLIIHYTR